MPIDLKEPLVIGISSSALFDMSEANRVYLQGGLDAYSQYQIENAELPLGPGTGLPLVKAVLRLNQDRNGQPLTTRRSEIVVASRNAPATSQRLFHSIKHHCLHDIQRSFLSGGAPIAPYLHAFEVDLFLSTNLEDVEAALQAEIPAALVYDRPLNLMDPVDQIRIAFDGDAVLFSDESEIIFQTGGIQQFMEHETAKADQPLAAGPFFKLLRLLSDLQHAPEYSQLPPVRIALITARSMPAHERVIKTLKEWNVRVDEAFFMGGVSKSRILEMFRPHIFFDDQESHCSSAAAIVPTARVPFGVTSKQIQKPSMDSVT